MIEKTIKECSTCAFYDPKFYECIWGKKKRKVPSWVFRPHYVEANWGALCPVWQSIKKAD